MPIVNRPDVALDQGSRAWLGIISTRPDQRHCGFIYDVDGERRLLHLAFHHMLLDEVYANDYWWSPVGLDVDNQYALAAIVSTIANGSARVPYGFDLGGIVFDKGTGAILQPPPGSGLTCATFVLSVFATYGFVPLAVETWPIRPGDLAWQDSMIAFMRGHGVPEDHISAIRSKPASSRFRPEEVVGGGVTDSAEWQIAFQRAEEIARQVLADMGVAA